MAQVIVVASATSQGENKLQHLTKTHFFMKFNLNEQPEGCINIAEAFGFETYSHWFETALSTGPIFRAPDL